MSKTALPVIAPAIVDALGISPALIGAFVTIMSAAGVVATMICGGFIVRYGALRMSQVALLITASGLVAAGAGTLVFLVVAAIVMGGGSTLSTPASSHLLARYSPPQYAPLIFSLKQTAVPAGTMLSGVLGPFLALALGWQGAPLVMAAMCVALALVLQPLRAEFDRDRNPAHPLTLADIKTTFAIMMSHAALRRMAFATFVFVGVQLVFTSFFVTYLAKGLGYPLATAGLVFSAAVAVAIPARILWGWVGSRFVAPRRLLAFLGIGMAASLGLTGFFTPDWPVPLVLAVGAAASATTLSWHGVLLAEVARLAPEGRIGALTGGVLSFGGVGQMIMPLGFGAVLAATGGYGLGFFAAGLIALVPGIALLRRERGPRGAEASAAPRS